MAKCDYCGSTILFGAKKAGSLQFCNLNCMQQGQLIAVSKQIPADVIQRCLRDTHSGLCPKCHGSGPIDVHTTHKVWSALILTSWSSKPQISCRACGTKGQLEGLAFSLVCGWWGFPWGLVMTPVQIARNIHGMASGPDPSRPSPDLERVVRLQMAQQVSQGTTR